MNHNDSERLSAILETLGFSPATSQEGADFVIFNTCSVREHAEQRIYGSMEELVERKKAGSDVVIAVTGCMAGRDKDGALRRRLHFADLFFPTTDMVHLPEWLLELRPEWTLETTVTGDDYLEVKPLRESKTKSYVTIQTGCNQFCTYCAVPYARGLEKNRSVAAIMQEVVDLARAGAAEVTLLGQAVNAYKAPDPGSFSVENPYQNDYAALLWEINNLPQIERVHWTAPHPIKMDDQVIDALRLPKQVNYLHLPVQSGSNDVLRRMNRKYTREQYLALIEKIKSARPGIALGTDIIVGFPGETDKDFEDTLDLYRECDFDISYNAQYSPRSGTLSYRLYEDDIAPEVKKSRWEALQKLMEETALRKNQKYLGQAVRVLVESVSQGILFGTNDELKIVCAPIKKLEVGSLNLEDNQKGSEMVGKFVQVRVMKPLTWILEGEILSAEQA